MPAKLGRKPRIYRPEVPHLSAIFAGRRPPPPPPHVDYMHKLPDDLGIMDNDILGDCTIAAIYHAIQLWTGNCGTMRTNPDEDVVQIYESFCGYDPNDPNTDQGGVEQDVLHHWGRVGVPDGGNTNKLAAWFEVDPRIQSDVETVIAECGVAYIGFNVPDNILPATGDPPAIWTYDANAVTIGGHAVVLGSYDASGLGVISWGKKYTMTWEFFRRYTDEAYALIDIDWTDATGNTPFGMTLAQLAQQMRALRR